MSDKTFIYCWNEGKSFEAVENKCVSCGKTLEEIFSMAPPEKKSESEEKMKAIADKVLELKAKPKVILKNSLQKSFDKLKQDIEARKK